MRDGEVHAAVNPAVGGPLRRNEPFDLFDGPLLEVVLVAPPKVACALDSTWDAFNGEILALDQTEALREPDFAPRA